MTRGAGVDNGQATMAQTNPAAVIIDRIRSPNALIVTTPMLETNKHRANVFFWLEIDDAGYATHRKCCALDFVLWTLILRVG
jgi:hypothetical protein